MKGFRVWSDYWKKYATESELYMDGSIHENPELLEGEG